MHNQQGGVASRNPLKTAEDFCFGLSIDQLGRFIRDNDWSKAHKRAG
jgi:hypothetical protein